MSTSYKNENVKTSCWWELSILMKNWWISLELFWFTAISSNSRTDVFHLCHHVNWGPPLLKSLCVVIQQNIIRIHNIVIWNWQYFMDIPWYSHTQFESGQYPRKFCGIYSTPRNNVMDMNNVMGEIHVNLLMLFSWSSLNSNDIAWWKHNVWLASNFKFLFRLQILLLLLLSFP